MSQAGASPGLTVAVTGAGGYLASRLVRRLSADDRVARVVALDVAPVRAPHPKVVADHFDVRNDALEERLAGVDVLVHLAFVMNPARDERAMRDVNVAGSHNAFRCAARAGVPAIVYASSMTVYGAHPDNDVPLRETSPLRANVDFSYAAHKLEVEYVVEEVRADYARTKIAVLRPAVAFGPHADNAWSHLLELPVLLGVRGHRPPLQFVHEDDAVDAFAFAVHARLDGAYNLVPPDWLDADAVDAIVGRRRVDVDEERAWRIAARLWELGLAEAPAGMLHYVMHPWVGSGDRLAAAGFRCERTSAEALAATARRARGRVRVGRWAAPRRAVLGAA
ncbi:MAG TPA: NAD-dependent epimerase/dehydratase family protein, partial [Actinomycetota bacterium]|nr:NAD-dependent epimerase/dehydratase family protein [Actinomycetota bacterium]